MKRNHLFASAAIGAVLVVTLPVHAQSLGGGLHGAVSSMQSARFGGGFPPTHSAVSRQTDLSASARTGARVDGLGRVDRTAKTETQEAGLDAERAKADAVVAGRGAVDAGKLEASKANDVALGTTRSAASSTSATSVTAARQGEAQVRSVDAAGVAAGRFSTTEVSATKAERGISKPSAVEPVKPDRAGSRPRSSATPAQPKIDGASNVAETARSAGSHGGIDANAAAAVNASAAH
ncbi:MAG TPA: hypothetical protein VIE42_07205 [Steroidobacteraceae bacterium]|jgi:hypothetical protein